MSNRPPKILGTATVANGATLSNEVNLRESGKLVGIECPALTNNGTVNIHIANTSGGTYRPLLLSDLSGNWEIASGTENLFVFVPDLAPFQFVKIKLGTDPGADSLFVFIGIQ